MIHETALCVSIIKDDTLGLNPIQNQRIDEITVERGIGIIRFGGCYIRLAIRWLI